MVILANNIHIAPPDYGHDYAICVILFKVFQVQNLFIWYESNI